MDVVCTGGEWWQGTTAELSTFSHLKIQKLFYSKLLEQEVLLGLQLQFRHQVLHTLLDDLSKPPLNISKKIIRTYHCVL
jgi:hypothetical protein